MTNFYRIAKTEVFLSNGEPITEALPLPGFRGRIIIQDLRTAFSIQKNLSSTTNSCILKIWNLSADKRNQLKNYGDLITLYAGYQNNTSDPIFYTGNTSNTEIIFIGTTTNVRHTYDYPDIVTTLECGDGEAISNDKTAQVSYSKGTPAFEALFNLANQIDIKISDQANVITSVPNTVYQTGYSYGGSAKDSIGKICDYLGLQWSVQNGMLQLIPIDGFNNKPSVAINADTGMIGVPERYSYKRLSFSLDGPKTGWRAKTTLKPSIIPGDPILLSSTHINLAPGPYRVETVRHEGDTFGTQWFSNMEVTLLA